MRQLKLIPSSNVLPLKIARALRQANPDGEANADNWLPGATEPPLPLTLQRLELIKAILKDPLDSAEESTATRMPQPVALAQPAPPAPDQSLAATPLLTSLLTISSGIRMLAAALILVALLPNLTLRSDFLAGPCSLSVVNAGSAQGKSFNWGIHLAQRKLVTGSRLRNPISSPLSA